MEVSRREKWLLDGTWSLSQVCLYNFKKKEIENNKGSIIHISNCDI